MSEAGNEGAVLRASQRCGFLNLRGDPANHEFLAGVASSLGVDLPLTPGSYQRGHSRTAYWLAPDEWLLALADGEQTAMESRLREHLRGHFSVADVSGGHVRFALVGAGARTVLQKACPYDFHPRSFAPGRCVQTVFAKATALIAADSDAAFELIIRSSYANYIRQWIAATLASD